MKKIVSIVGMMLGALLVVGVLQKPIHSNAATTYKLTYNAGEWYSSGDNGVTWYSGGASFITEHFQDGDVIIVDGQSSSTEMITFSVPGKIGEIAVIGGAQVNVTAKGATLAYAVTGGNVLIINCDVDTLNANHGAVNQVNGNVGRINATYKDGDPIKVGVTGTVGSANVLFSTDKWTQKTVYNVAAGKFELDNDGYFVTKADYYSLDPSSAPASNSSASSNQGGQLDKVPKTGRGSFAVILIAVAGLFIEGGLILYRKTR